jgi:hypothetical protein
VIADHGDLSAVVAHRPHGGDGRAVGAQGQRRRNQLGRAARLAGGGGPHRVADMDDPDDLAG